MKKTSIILSFVALTIFPLVLKAGDDKAKSLIAALEKAVGTWDKLYSMKNVQFDYEYLYPEPGIKDLSVEKYIFEGEHSYAKYSVHQINVAKDMEGEVYQCYNGKSASIKIEDKMLEDPQTIGSTQFLRKANYFWFVMNFKINEPAAKATYMGTEEVNGINYDKVSVSYSTEDTGKENNDAYLLYLNPDTHLVDHFYFSLPVMGVNQTAIKMELEYETIEGLQLTTKRKIYMPGKDGKLSTTPNLIQTSSNISFNNDFAEEDLKL